MPEHSLVEVLQNNHHMHYGAVLRNTEYFYIFTKMIMEMS